MAEKHKTASKSCQRPTQPPPYNTGHGLRISAASSHAWASGRRVREAPIDNVMAPRAVREAAWVRLAQDLDSAKTEPLTREMSLADAVALGSEILAGHVRGRLMVNVNRCCCTGQGG